MEEKSIKFCWLQPENSEDLSLPSYESEFAAGMDICADIPSPLQIKAGQRVLVNTGLAVSIPKGYEIQVRPRSGLAAKHGITVLNSPGTIDSDYRGEIKICLINHGNTEYTINRSDRIAQLILAPVVRGRIELVEVLDTTVRGDGGFGHTGK